MKKIKIYSLRYRLFKNIRKKIFLFFILLNVIFYIFIGSGNNLFTDILGTSKISKDQLYSLSTGLKDTNFIWPIKEITDLSNKSLQDFGIEYSKVRDMKWEDIPYNLKTEFPLKVSDFIIKYQNLTLENAWKYIKDSKEYNYYTFIRRIIRTTWLASYKSKNIWKKGTGTHAGVDIIGNIGTPIYSIGDGLVIEIKSSNKGFGNYISILYKSNGKYYLVFYGHMDKIYKSLKVGNYIKKGDFIGTIGNSGNSFGSHLHLQINKVFTIQDIVNGKVMLGWFHDIEGVKAYTVDPINFIESNYDNSFIMHKKNIIHKIKEEKIKNKIKKKEVNQGDNLDLLTAISKEIENIDIKEVKSKKTIAGIKSIKVNLIGNKIQVGHNFSIDIEVYTGNGKISIVKSNMNLKLSKDYIENPDKGKYTIFVTALKEGETNISISDSLSTHNFKIFSYIPESEKIFGLKLLLTGNLNLLEDKKLLIYPINRFGKRLNKKINGLFKIYFMKGDNKKLYKEIAINSTEGIVYIRPYYLGKQKLIVEGGKYYIKINTLVNVSKDYTYYDKYAGSMKFLIEKGIIKGENGNLYPNRKITRRELLTIIGRSVLDINYEKLKSDMEHYVRKKGKFFKDINGDISTDVYIYAAWKRGIVKGENGYSLASNYVSKAELLTIYSRLFNLDIEKTSISYWKDLKISKLKYIADTVKKYNLYPFENLDYFSPGSLVVRIKAFESLKRFMLLNIDSEKHLSADVVDVNDPKKDLEEAMAELFKF